MILISPWSRNTHEGKPSPKNYPHWTAVVNDLHQAGHRVIQLSCSGEADVPGTERMNDLPLDTIEDLIKTCTAWISVDNFFHHLAWTLGRPGIVIFGMSDPEIFGHPENINLLKDRRYLRKWQYRFWSQEPVNEDAFVAPKAVVNAVITLVRKT